MKKVFVFLLTAVMLVNTVAFASMVIPSETSPNPLSEINITSDGFYGQLDIVPNGTSNGTTSGAKIFKDYLVVPSVFYNLYDNERNRITVCDLSLNTPTELASWNLGELGVPYYPKSASDSTPIADGYKQNSIYAMALDNNYIYLAVAYNRNPYLYVFTNPLSGEITYGDDGMPVIDKPTLVSGPTEILSGCINLDQVWGLNILPKLEKVGDYLIYTYINRTLGNQCVAYINVKDAANPVKKVYDAQSLFSYNNTASGADSAILGAAFEGNIGYYVVADNASAANWTNANLFKIDFKHPTEPIVMGKTTLATGDATPAGGNGAMVSVSIGGNNLYLSVVNNGKLSKHFWKLNKNTMSISDEIKGSAASSVNNVGYFYDTGDMLICVRNENYARQTYAVRFGEKGEDGQTTVTTQSISAIQNMQGQTNLDAFPLGILAYGTKLYFPFGLGGAYGKNTYKQSTVGYIDLDSFGPFTFTADAMPSIVYDEATVSGSLCIPQTAGEVGVHLYINGNSEPVDAEIIYDTVFGSVISKWQYTLTEPGNYNIAAKLYDAYGDYENIAKNIKFTLKSTTGLNASTNYSVHSSVPAVEIPETVKKLSYDGFNEYPETWVTGYDYRNGYLAMSMTNRGIYYTSTAGSSAEKDENGAYIINSEKYKARNQLAFYNLNDDGSIGDAAKIYDGEQLGMSKTLAWNKPSRYTSLTSIYGMTMDDDYIYLLVNEPRSNHYVVDYALYIYKNPYNKATGTFSDEIEKVGRVVVNNSNASANENGLNNMCQPDSMTKVSYDGSNYIILADIYNQKYAVVDVTDTANPARKAFADMKSFSDNGLTLTSVHDMEFDGKYAYISGANNGTINETDKTLSDAYYAAFKVDFTNPLEPVVAKSWKLLDADYGWLNRDGHSSYSTRTALAPQLTMDISGGKVIATLSTSEQYLSNYIKEQLGSLKAYVLGDTVTPLSAVASTTANTANGYRVTHNHGSEHVYFVNGLYYAETWDKYDNGRAGGNYVIGYPSDFEANMADATKQAYHSELVPGARLLSAYEINGRLYTNYYLASVDGKTGTTGNTTTFGAVGCMNFKNAIPYISKLSIEGSGTYYAEIELENNFSTKALFTPVAALFKDGKLVDITVGERQSVAAGKTASEKLEVSVPTDTDYSKYIIKTFIFDSIDNIKPLTMRMSMDD